MGINGRTVTDVIQRDVGGAIRQGPRRIKLGKVSHGNGERRGATWHVAICRSKNIQAVTIFTQLPCVTDADHGLPRIALVHHAAVGLGLKGRNFRIAASKDGIAVFVACIGDA